MQPNVHDRIVHDAALKLPNSVAESNLRDHALDSLRVGVFLLDSLGYVVFANHYAQKLLMQKHGLLLKSNRLSAAHPKSANLLTAAIDDAYLQGQSMIVNIFRAAQSALSVSVVPQIHARSIAGSLPTQAAVFVSDPEDREIGSADYLHTRWKLTPLESRFCLHMLRGYTIAEVAQHMELTLNTAQWYSKQICAKLGVKRHSAVVALLLRDAGSFLSFTPSTIPHRQ